MLVVSGDVDVAATPTLARSLEQTIASGHVRLVVDLTGVGFLRSPAITALLEALHAVRERGGALAVVVATDMLRTTFAVTGLEEELGVTGARVDALRRVRAGSVASG